jgi:protease-4
MLPRELIAADLIDGEKYLDEVLEPLGDIVHGRDYAGIDPSTLGFDPVAQYALIYGSGTVVMGEAAASPSGSPVFASDRIAKALADAGKDPKIDAIILRIDSPGGSALASEIVWRAVKQVRELGKPVVASYSDLAASGGYYASAGADAIVSAAGALTGSIGVFMLRPQFSKALDRLGIGVEALTRGRLAELQLASRPLSPAARSRLQVMVSDTYALFVDRVAEGRKLTPQAVDRVGQGRVWTGAQALERGLVDELGGLRTAVLAAKRLSGLDPDDDVSLVPFPQARPLATQIAELLNARLAAAVRPFPLLADPLHPLFEALALLPRDAPLALAPFLPDVH